MATVTPYGTQSASEAFQEVHAAVESNIWKPEYI